MSSYRFLPAGDTAIVVEFGDRIDKNISMLVLALAQRMRDVQLSGVIETVPTFRSLMIHYDPIELPAAALTERLVDVLANLNAFDTVGRHWRLPVCYDPSLAPDLDEVTSQIGISPAQLVERHSALTYHVYMLGFLPGFAYLGDLPSELILPRRQTPRLKVPQGSLAIATTMTCVYPLECPGGWHLIGRCPVPLWDGKKTMRAVLAAGDKVSFSPVSLSEYEVLMSKAANGALEIAPTDELARNVA